MKKIKYLAIGDSITQGFNNTIGSGTCGIKNESKKIKGFSFPDFFIDILEKYFHYLNKNDMDIEYDNLGLSVLRSVELNDLLEENFSNDFISLKKMNKYIEKMANLNIQDNIWKINNELSNKENFLLISNKFKNKIRDANLITITIGGNEFQSSIPLDLIREFVSEPNYYKQQKLKISLVNKIKEIILKIKLDYIKLVKLIRNINPESKIILLNYPLPFLPILKKYDFELKRKNFKIFNNFIDKFSELGSDVISEIANETNSFYCNIFNKKFWFKKSKILFSNAFDFHPSIYGYMEIARELFNFCIKNRLINEELNYNLKFKKWLNFNRNIFFHKNMFLKNKNKYLNIDPFSNIENNVVFILRAWTQNNNSSNNPYIRLFREELKKTWNNQRSYFIANRENYLSSTVLVVDYILLLLKQIDKKSTVYEYFRNNLINEENLKEISQKIIFNNEIAKLFTSAEYCFRKNSKKPFSVFLNKFIFENIDVIFKIIKETISTSKQFNKKIVDFIELIIKNLDNEKIFILGSNSISILLEVIFENKEFINLIKPLFNSIISVIKNMNIFKSFDEIINYFISENTKNIKILIKKIIEIIFNKFNDDFETLSKIFLNILNLKSTDLNNKEWKMLDLFLLKLINYVKEEQNVEYIIDVFIKVSKKVKIKDTIDFNNNSALNHIKKISRKVIKTINFSFFKKENIQIINLLWNFLLIKIINKIRKFFKW